MRRSTIHVYINFSVNYLVCEFSSQPSYIILFIKMGPTPLESLLLGYGTITHNISNIFFIKFDIMKATFSSFTAFAK